MKQIKNAMLAIVCGLSIVTIATISSCSSNPSPSPTVAAPTISNTFTPTTGGAGTTITITGTNFTGATAVTVGGTAAASFAVNGAGTSITITIGSGSTGVISVTTPGGTVSTTSSFTFVALSTGPTSDSVAKANLIAHWTFDNTEAESFSGLKPAVNGNPVSYTTGQIGSALAFDSANLVYPVIPALNNANALSGGFTLTMWFQSPVQTLFTSLWQLNGNIGDIFGLVGLCYRKNPNDTLDFDGGIVNATTGATASTAFNANIQGAASGFKVPDATWSFITMTYDSTAKTLNYYGNGKFYGSYTIPGSVIAPGTVFTLLTTTSPAATGNTATSQVSFGSLDVNPPFTGSSVAPAGWQSPVLTQGTVIDDTRLFNTTLSTAQIDSLYTLGSAGK